MKSKVFLTGHTGFKGAWFIHLLSRLGHGVSGYSDKYLPGSLYEKSNARSNLQHEFFGDVRDKDALLLAARTSQADVMVHFAAQPLVLEGFANPYLTFETNIMGTINAIFCARDAGLKRILVITTDKVYRDMGQMEPYSESSPLGGYDPYSSSKAAADLVAQSLGNIIKDGFRIDVARGGNVIGGGDISPNRLVPDIETAINEKTSLELRNSGQVRPWQHVLDCLDGYLNILESHDENTVWNVGPDSSSETLNVMQFVEHYLQSRGEQIGVKVVDPKFKETDFLALNSSLIQSAGMWKPKLNSRDSIALTAEYYTELKEAGDSRAVLEKQVSNYLRARDDKAKASSL